MAVYVDILIFLNIIIDYLLISLSSYITKNKIKTPRLIVSSIFASLFSLTIFLPYLGAFVELLIRIFYSFIICLAAFGYINFKFFIKNYASFLTVNIVFNGLMSGIWIIFKPGGMILNNSSVYFNISAIELIVLSVIFYIIFRIVLAIIRKQNPTAKRCKLTLYSDNNCLEIEGIIDTGNSLCDIYNNRQVIITDEITAEKLFGNLQHKNKQLLPFKTINGTGILPSYICKKAFVNNKNVGTVLVAVIKDTLDGDYKAILNPEILNIR